MGMGGWLRLEQTRGCFFWFCCCLIKLFFFLFFTDFIARVPSKSSCGCSSALDRFCQGPVSLAVKAWRDKAALCRQGRIHAVAPGSLGSTQGTSSCRYVPPPDRIFDQFLLLLGIFTHG